MELSAITALCFLLDTKLPSTHIFTDSTPVMKDPIEPRMLSGVPTCSRGVPDLLMPNRRRGATMSCNSISAYTVLTAVIA